MRVIAKEKQYCIMVKAKALWPVGLRPNLRSALRSLVTLLNLPVTRFPHLHTGVNDLNSCHLTTVRTE